MKPRNFPGRKNDRRKAVLSRMAKPRNGLSLHEEAMHPYNRLCSRILPDSIARGIRTKKDRRDRAKFAVRS